MWNFISPLIRYATLVLCIGYSSSWAQADTASYDGWTSEQWDKITSLSLNKLPDHVFDPSNKVLRNPLAIQLGRKLFFDTQFSLDGKVACTTCHHPDHRFSDTRSIVQGAEIGLRNTPSLLNTAYNDWFFWDGRKDSLWSQALSPLENKNEHALTRIQIVARLLHDKDLTHDYKRLFGAQDLVFDKEVLTISASPIGYTEEVKAWKKLDAKTRNQIDKIFTNIGKAIASFVATLRVQPSRFDRYIEEVLIQNQSSQLSSKEKAGLSIFISKKAACLNCHNGPQLSNGNFHNIGTGRNKGDSGRSAVIQQVLSDRFNCLGTYSDATDEQCLELRYMSRDTHGLLGAFKTPSLRNVSETGPYMHDGRYSTLKSVLDHYTGVSKRNMDTHLPAIKLDDEHKELLIEFLTSLTGTKNN